MADLLLERLMKTVPDIITAKRGLGYLDACVEQNNILNHPSPGIH